MANNLQLVLINFQIIGRNDVFPLTSPDGVNVSANVSADQNGEYRISVLGQGVGVVASSFSSVFNQGDVKDLFVTTNLPLSRTLAYSVVAELKNGGSWVQVDQWPFNIAYIGSTPLDTGSPLVSTSPIAPLPPPSGSGIQIPGVTPLPTTYVPGPTGAPVVFNPGSPNPNYSPVTGLGQQSDKKVDVITIPSWAWIVGGVGVAAVAIFAILGMQRRDAF